jgi:outer membrane protein insertion porin family
VTVTSRALASAAGLLLLALPLAGRAGEAAPGGIAPVVSSVSFQVASPYLLSYDELASLVKIRPGDLLTEAAVKDSIRELYAKSIFREVTAYARDDAGKTELMFFLFPYPVISDVEVTGEKRVPVAQILSASRIRRGTPLEGRDLREAEEAVRKALEKKGFIGATVSISVTCSLESGVGKLRIDVREGAPGVVRSVELPGASFFTREMLLEKLGVSPGSTFDYRRCEKGILQLRSAYKRAGFLTVRIAEAEITSEGGRAVRLVVRVEEGPRYEVRWEGPSRYSIAKMEKASGVYGDEETTEVGIVHDLRERLLAFHRDRNYLRAEVDVDVEEKSGGLRQMKITVRPGMEGYLKEVRFEGNAGIPAKQLRKQITSEERGFFSFVTGSGKLREEDWNDDMGALVGLYQKEGFVRARIPSVDTAWDERGGITRTIHIEEGVRYKLREIRFRGNDHFLREELMAHAGNREGGFVDYVGLEHDQEAIAGHYRDAGYLDVHIKSKLEFDEGKETVGVQFDVEEGPRYLLGKVIVRGGQLTDPIVILREIGIREGSPAGERDLLKFQQAVFGTGLYKSVRIQKVKRPSEGIMDLIVEVEETLFFEVEYGAGYGTDTGVRGFVGVKHRNLDGKGRNFFTRLSVSQKEQKYLWSLREPWIFGNRWKWEGGLTGFYQDAVRESFSLRKTSVVASITRTFFDRSSLSLQYDVSRDDVFDVKPGAILSTEDQGTAYIAAGRGLFVFDFRDDPFNPRRGSFNSGSAELASYYFGSEVDYYKVAGQSSWYFPVFRRSTFVVSGRAGYIHPLRDTKEVPIQKRFFLGGRTTVRGFREESLGPRAADGTPTGGNYMMNLNTELRVPLQYGFNVAVFVDAGSVWIHGVPDGGFDIRKASGLGLRYVTPIGPIGLDYAWKLDRREKESASEWHFTIGAVF